MKLSFVEPRAELKPYIQSIWVFESPMGMPPSDTNLAAPNGCPKPIFSYKNSITSIAEGRVQEGREQDLYFVGTRDISVHLRTARKETGFVGIEFHPHGAYPIFGIPMVETTNRLLPAEVLSAKWGRDVGDILRNRESVSEKIDFIQSGLVALLGKRQLQNPFVEYCVNSLKSTNGLIAISDLERKSGYSRRYLEILFKNHVGVSPKTLASIFRFQTFYRRSAQRRSYDEIKEELNDYYYDQSHFVKEFKRMTGFSPQQFTLNVSNEFGRQLAIR